MASKERIWFKTSDQRAYWEAIDGQRSPYHPVVRYFSKKRWEFVGKVCPLREVSSVLDLGCGRGTALVYFKKTGRHLVGVDFSQYQLASNPIVGLKKVVGSVERLPFNTDAFDLVTCWEVLHHVKNPSLVIKEMTRVSRQWIVIFEPNVWNPAQFLFSILVSAERGSLRLRPSLITKILDQGGFETIYVCRGGWIFPNRCPRHVLPMIRQLPFWFPGLGISRLWIARKADKQG